MGLNENLRRYIADCSDELRMLIRDLCAIPAPSHHEQARAEFCRKWFQDNGAEGVYVDDALNVICPWNDCGGNDLVVFMAHTDTVFPDLEPMPFHEADGRMYAPGVTDDTANLAVLMLCARYVLRHGNCGDTGALFVANSCEEGLGNLKGCRAVMQAFGGRVRELITLDGFNLQAVVAQAVGSHRYRITVRTEGGHSFGDFGKPNAIHCISNLVSELYSVRVPQIGNSKTTYNVGMISGGTSVNTIAQQAEILYEYRSDNVDCLAQMEDMFRFVIGKYSLSGVDIDVERIGERPCGRIDGDKHAALLDRIGRSVYAVTGREAVFTSGSTDANVPLSMGIPAACISACEGGKCHTREEWLDVESLDAGCALFLHLLDSYFDLQRDA